MNEHNLSTNELLLRLRHQDEKEQTATLMHILYLRFMPQLYRYGINHMLDDDEATSAGHDTLLRVYQHRNSYDETRGTAEAWIGSIHKNIVIDWLRKKPRPLLEELVESYPAPDRMMPEYSLENSEYTKCILRAWNRLTESDKQELQGRRKPGPVSQARKAAFGQFRTFLAVELGLAGYTNR